MKHKKLIYWLLQFFGWGFYFSITALLHSSQGKLNSEEVLNLFYFFVLGVFISHFYRFLILKQNWLRLKITKVIPRVLIASIVCGIVYSLLHIAFLYFLLHEKEEVLSRTVIDNVINIISLSVIFFFWTVIYFAAYYTVKSRKEEIKNLEWEALSTEIELNNLKAQLNPHFMFNSMNSIRALIDENPAYAKESITKLSLILRNTLLMGRKQLVSFEEELKLVKDYLSLEEMRYEERLAVVYDIQSETLKCMVPPLMVQTLVENAIKHGISKLVEGGVVQLLAVISGDDLVVTVTNSGELNFSIDKNEGFGIKNTEQRLQLLFSDKGAFTISRQENLVIAKITLPKEINEII